MISVGSVLHAPSGRTAIAWHKCVGYTSGMRAQDHKKKNTSIYLHLYMYIHIAYCLLSVAYCLLPIMKELELMQLAEPEEVKEGVDSPVWRLRLARLRLGL